MDDHYPQLRNKLSTRDGFQNAVVVRGWWDAALVFCFSVIFLLAMWDLSVKMTGGSRSDRDSWSPVLLVLWSVVFVGTCVCIYVANRSIRSRVGVAFERYQTAGFVADMHMTGVSLPAGRAVWALVLFVEPGVPDEVVSGFSSRLCAELGADVMSSEGAQWWARVSSGGALSWWERVKSNGRRVWSWWAVPAQQVDASFPTGVWLSLSRPNNKVTSAVFEYPDLSVGKRPVVLIPNGSENATVYVLKKNVVLT